MSKEIQKVTKLTIEVLKEENALAVRGLKDLQLTNTPRLKYLAGLYDECINLCVEMKNGIEAPEPEDPEEKHRYLYYGPTKYIKDPVELSKEDYWYWNLSLQKIGRFFVTDEEFESGNSEKSWAYPILLSFVGLEECIQLFKQRLKNDLVCNADYWYYAVCLEEQGNIEDAIEYWIKSLQVKVEVKRFAENALYHIGNSYYKLKNYELSKQWYLKYFSDLNSKRIKINHGFLEIDHFLKLIDCFYFLGDEVNVNYYLGFIQSPNEKKAQFYESKGDIELALKEYKLVLEKNPKHKKLEDQIFRLENGK